jgi:hypothetical protein
MGSTGQWGWKNQVATIYKAKVRGQMFLPVPQGYSGIQTALPRGSQIPEIVAQSNGTDTALPAAAVKTINPVTGQITYSGGAMDTPTNGLEKPPGQTPVGENGGTCSADTKGLLPTGSSRPMDRPNETDPTTGGKMMPM